MTLPSSFRASSERTLSSLILDRLERVMPETGTPLAITYIEEASLLLSLYRSFQGITASANKGLIPLFDSVLRGTISDGDASALKNILASEKDSAVSSSEANAKAQRVKGAYHLAMAASMRRS